MDGPHARQPWLLDGTTWVSNPDLLPDEWVEKERASGAALEEARTEALRFASRRRRESESPAVLAEEPLPPPFDVPKTDPPEDRPLQRLHPDTPAGPIQQARLFLDAEQRAGSAAWRSADLDTINSWMRRASTAVRAFTAIDDAKRVLEDTQSKAAAAGGESPLFKARIAAAQRALNALPKPDPPTDVVEIGQDRFSVWARDRIWLCVDPSDCVLEQPSTPECPVPCEVNREFFVRWGKALGWTDHVMIHGILAGIDSRSECEKAIVLRFHHKGLTRNFRPARESIEQDSDPKRGWISLGTPHMQYVPGRLIARNVAEQTKWKLTDDGPRRVVKYRVTTDDTASDSMQSRNDSLPRDEWWGPHLTSVSTYARAVAVLMTWMPREMAVGMVNAAIESGIEEENVVLWAIDLSDAYRKLAVQRLERWLQLFIWEDGCRADYRAVFGTASMVQVFGRISLLLQAVTRVRIDEWMHSRYVSPARAAWQKRKTSRAFYIGMYIDDELGATACPPGEPVRRRTNARNEVIDPHAAETTGEGQIRIATEVAAEAGWTVKTAKIQLGQAIEPLGFLVDAARPGRIKCTVEKRAGIGAELSEHAMASPHPRGVPFEDVERLVGKLVNLATVIVEGRAHLEPLYRMKCAKYTIATQRGARRVHPSRLALVGTTQAQVAYQGAVAWWKAALHSDMQIPLAPRLHFPAPSEPGCIVTFQDAARGAGTGLGGFAPLVSRASGERQLLVLTEVWPDDLQQSLYTNVLSMPAGELFALVCLAASLHHHVHGASHVIALSDSDPAARAINFCASGSPQLQALLLWFYELCPSLQSLAIWLPGKLNSRSDALSRGRQKAAAAVAEAEAAGWRPHTLPLPPHAFDVLRSIAKLPQHA